MRDRAIYREGSRGRQSLVRNARNGRKEGKINGMQLVFPVVGIFPEN